MRRLAALLFASALALSLHAETVPALPKPTGYVSDIANVLPPDARARIEAQCTALHQRTGTQLAVVTIKTLEGATAQQFAQDLSDAWGVGSKGTDKGLILLVVTGDRKRWINVGYGLEGPLNDARVGDIGRDMVPALSQKHWDEGIELGVTELAAAITADPAAQPIPKPSKQPDESGLVAALFFGGLAFIVLMIVWLARRGRRHHPPTMSSHSHLIVNRAGDPIHSAPAFVSSSTPDLTSSSSPDTSSSSSPSDFSSFGGGSSGGGGAGGDF